MGYYSRKRQRRIWEGAGLPYRPRPSPPVVFEVVRRELPRPSPKFGRGPSTRARRVRQSSFDRAVAGELRLLARLPPDVDALWRLGAARLELRLEERTPRPEGFVPTGLRFPGFRSSRPRFSEVDGFHRQLQADSALPPVGWSSAGKLVVVDAVVDGGDVFRLGRATLPETVARIVGAAWGLGVRVLGDAGADAWVAAGMERKES